MSIRAARSIQVVTLLLLASLLAGCSSAPTVPSNAGQKKPQPKAKVESEGKGAPVKDAGAPVATTPTERKVIAAFLVRSNGTPFQALRYLEAHSVPAAKVPGIQDVSSFIALTGQPLAPDFLCVERLNESLIDNMGQRLRSLVSYRAYIDPFMGHTMAYDLATTSGGVPDRTIGYRTKKGCHVTLYRGGEEIESKDVDFQPGVEIFPISMDFVHVFFIRNPDRTKFVRKFFVPEVMTFLELEAVPKGAEMVAIGGRNYECVKYWVRTGSPDAGYSVEQHLWFDKQRKTLVKHAGRQSQESEETVGERVEPERLKSLTPKIVRPEKLAADRPFPYPLDKELVYLVHMGEDHLGQIRLRFNKQVADDKGPEGWRAHAKLHLTVPSRQGAGGNQRQEESLTRFDKRFRPIEYLVTGFESAQARAEYTIRAQFIDEHVTLRIRRETKPLVPVKAVGGGAEEPAEPAAASAANAWDEPLRRISLPGEEEPVSEPANRVQNERFTRPLSRGTFVHDYHRIEHLAVALYRLPFPEPQTAKGPPTVARQRVALYAVRHNKSALAPFAVSIEPKPKDSEKESPDFYIAMTNSRLAPGRVLLDDKGRIIQWVTRYGTKEVVYTLDDPVMRKREKRAQFSPTQDGPMLLRPPWY